MSLTAKVVRFLPRVFLLLVLLTVVYSFRHALMPFALAIFVAYLLYPVIMRLENGHLGRWTWRMPRWTAVIVIYSVLFTIGWHTVPSIVVSLASEVQQLADQVPSMFERFTLWQGEIEESVQKQMSVTELPSQDAAAIGEDLRRLQEGRLLLFSPPPRPVTDELDSADTTGNDNPATGPPSISLFNIEFHFGESGNSVSTRGPQDSSTTNSDGEDSEAVQELVSEGLRRTEDGGESSTDDSSTEDVEGDGKPTEDGTVEDVEPQAHDQEATPVDPALRFSNEAYDSTFEELKAFLNGHLMEEGPAKPELATAAQSVLDELNSQYLKLPQDDEAFIRLKQLVANHVQGSLRREQLFVDLRGSVREGLLSARVWATGQLKRSTSLVGALVTGIFDFFLILMLTAFFLVFFSRIRGYLRDLIPPSYREDYNAVLKRIDTRLSGAIRGQVIICIVNGFLTYPGILIIGYLFNAPALLQFALLLSVVASILSLIPIFGVIISTVPMVLLALTGSLTAALAVTLWISIIHAIEAYILNPNILGHSAQMNPIIVVFALLAGKQTGGLFGALLAVPIASVVVAMFGYYRRRMSKVYAAESGIEADEDTWGD